MTHIMQLVSDGETTMDINDETIFIGSYIPSNPELLVQQSAISRGNGRHVGKVNYGDVVDTMDMMITGVSAELVRQRYQSIERFLEKAIDRRKDQTIKPVYLSVQWADEAAAWQAEILYGELTMVEESISQLLKYKMECRLIIGRTVFKAAEIELSISNADSPSPATGGITIYNHNDGGAGESNYVDIPVQVGMGTIPSPCRIVLTNTAGVSINYRNFYIGQSVFPIQTSFDHIIEGEDNETLGGAIEPLSGISDAVNYSGGFYYARSWTGALASTALYTFTIDGNNLEHAGGGYFRVMAKLVTPPNDSTYVKLGLYHQTTTRLTPEVEVKLAADTALKDLGTLRLPPSLIGATTLGDLTLRITARSSASGTLNIDYLQLTPLSGWRHLKIRGGIYTDGTEFVDDGINERVYTNEGGTDIYANFTVKGGDPIVLRPRSGHRLYFLADESTGTNIGRTFSVQVFYQPRRKTI